MAIFAPVPGGSPLERLRASGEILPGEGDFDDLPNPLPVPAGREAPSTVLEQLRRDVR